MSAKFFSQMLNEEENSLENVEALLAGTLALMTGVAQAESSRTDVGPMASKIATNLQALADYPELSETMHHTLGRLSMQWRVMAGEQRPDVSERVLWLRSPGVLQ